MLGGRTAGAESLHGSSSLRDDEAALSHQAIVLPVTSDWCSSVTTTASLIILSVVISSVGQVLCHRLAAGRVRLWSSVCVERIQQHRQDALLG